MSGRLYTPRECINLLKNLGLTDGQIAKIAGLHRVTVCRLRHNSAGSCTNYAACDALRIALSQRIEEVRALLAEYDAATGGGEE